MNDVKDLKQKPTLEQIQGELRGTFIAIGVLLNETFYRDSGSRLIGVPLSPHEALLGTVDLNKTIIGRNLPIYYEYAYEGRVVPGYESEVENDESELIERLNDFAQIFQSDSSYFDLCLEVAGIDVKTDVGRLQDMLDRLRARHSLDKGYAMSIDEISLLADMAERSVRNALTAEGPSRLYADKNGYVKNAEARRWLEGRRGFVQTQRRLFPEGLDECPDQLDGLEIPSFVQDRIAKRFGENRMAKMTLTMASSPAYDGAYEVYPEIIQKAAKAAQLPEASIQDAMQQPLRIKPEDCPSIAKAISVDPVWFTMQVMRALFPTQMDMLLNPTHYSTTNFQLGMEGKSVDIILSEAMIKHGYLDLPAHAKVLFPEDCFGTRVKGDAGNLIELHYGGKVERTDMRIKSEQTISPRKRFNSWLQKELFAASGDRIRLTRTGDRVYELTHIPK